MNTPNPLMPQGSLQNLSQGKSTVRIAVFAIVTIHAVFFGGLLLQGCNRDGDKLAGGAGATNLANELPKLSNDYYTNFTEVPSVTTNLPLATTLTNESPAQLSPPPVTPARPVTPAVAETVAETKEYTVVRGDTFSKIAKAHKVKVDAVVKANPDVDPKLLRPGQKIVVPAPTPATAPASTGPGLAEPAKPESGPTHVVKAGENLTIIASQHGTTAKAIRAANNLKSDRILAGQKLKLPPPSKPTGAAAGSRTAGNQLSSATNPTAAGTLMATPTGTTNR